MKYFSILSIIICLLFFSCSKHDEYSLEELDAMGAMGLEEILEKTVSKPWRGEKFSPGRLGGTWYDVMSEDPKSFNHLIAEKDSATRYVVGCLTDYFIDYNVVTREWESRVISVDVTANEANNTMRLICTLRDDLFWSYYNSDRKVKVTSDDVIFWYDEIRGDPDCQSSGYYQQFLVMPDGSEARVTIEKIDDRRFAFNLPRIIAEPHLSINMDFGPRHVYEPAKRQGGVDAVNNLFNVSVDPKTIPSMGEWFLVEYTAGQRLVYKRNPNYWKKDANGVSIPYTDEMILRIIPEENTQMLLFVNSELDSHSLRPEDIDGLVNKVEKQYTVFNRDGSLSAAFWTFNQNPVNKDKPQYEWFTQKEFRQAMSCLLNRDRINAQVYLGLAEPKLNIFPEPNPYYNPSITNQYLYDKERALELLASIGFKKDIFGTMRDNKNRRVQFDITIRSESVMYQDTASIIMDELSKIGIKVNIRVVDFQKQVEQLFSSFDWDSTLMLLSGSGIFPSQGSNTWPSSGNLHMWNPNQKTPATEWEARVDYLYNEGRFTLDESKAREIWDEFQSIITEQCPMIYLMRSRGFWALNNRWDFTNVYFDNLNGAETTHIYLKGN